MEIGRSLYLTGAGMGMVFLVLALLMGVILALGRLFKSQASRTAPVPEEKEPLEREEEKVAAIAVSLALAEEAVPSPALAAGPPPSPWRVLGRQALMGGIPRRHWRG